MLVLGYRDSGSCANAVFGCARVLLPLAAVMASERRKSRSSWKMGEIEFRGNFAMNGDKPIRPFDPNSPSPDDHRQAAPAASS